MRGRGRGQWMDGSWDRWQPINAVSWYPAQPSSHKGQGRANGGHLDVGWWSNSWNSWESDGMVAANADWWLAEDSYASTWLNNMAADTNASDEMHTLKMDESQTVWPDANIVVDRKHTIAKVFERLDLDRDGWLSVAEMRFFAEFTGFAGSDEEWDEEYRLLCADAGCDPGRGVDLAAFTQLVDDDSDGGCHCTDDELCRLIQQQLDAKQTPPAIVDSISSDIEIFDKQADNVSGWWADDGDDDKVATNGPTVATNCKDGDERDKLKRDIFECLDGQSRGFLQSAELRVFATHTGFDGGDIEWQEEYALLCTEAGRNMTSGLDFASWSKLVDDDSDTGCYCSDEELGNMLQALKPCAGASTADIVDNAASAKAQSPAADSQNEISSNVPQTREDLKTAVFKCFDTDGDGRLRRSELRRFADHTGFDGGDEDWGTEYQLLCREVGQKPEDGLDIKSFSALVDDKSEDAGCYCTDEELSAMISSTTASMASKVHQTATVTSPTTLHGITPARSVPPQDRDTLKHDVFLVFDKDQDTRLNREELLTFARHVGFPGSDAEWGDEYELLCRDACVNPGVGIDLNAFRLLVDDDSDAGCYASDDELRKMLMPASESEKVEEEIRIPDANPTSPRSQLKRDVFRRLDTDGNGFLDSRELWPFVQQTGFEGSKDEWTRQTDGEYALLCGDLGCDPEIGVSFEKFISMIEDQSDSGCYCTDAELQEMLNRLPEIRKNPPNRAKPTQVGAVGVGIASETHDHVNANTLDAADPWSVSSDPWDKAAESQESKSKGKGKGKAKGKGKDRQEDTRSAQGKGKNKTNTADGNDPLAAAFDPWATPSAQRAATQLRDDTAAKEQSADAAWNNWTKPDSVEESKPALNAQKLLEASRAALAARKAQEASKRAESEAVGDTSLGQQAGTADDYSSGLAGPEVSQADVQRIVKATSMPAALSMIGTNFARLVAGDRNATEEFVDSVLGAPSLEHALAVVSSVCRATLQGRRDEAKTLLGIDELIVDPTEGEANVLSSLTELTRRVGTRCAPFLLRVLLSALSKVDDKQTKVRYAAASVTDTIVTCNNCFAFEALLPTFLATLDAKRSPSLKLRALKLLSISHRREGEVALAQKTPQLLPVISQLLLDTSAEVRTAAGDAVDLLFRLSANADLKPHLNEIRGCASGNKDVSKCVKDLAEVVFVQRVDAPALAVVMPVLVKGLKSRMLRTQRQAAIIAENMCRLLPSAADVQPFVPQLLPLLVRVSEEAADPDVRAVASRARQSFAQIADTDTASSVRRDLRDLLSAAIAAAEAEAKAPGASDVHVSCPIPVRNVIVDYVVCLCEGLARCHVGDEKVWRMHLSRHLEPLVSARHAEPLVRKLGVIGQRLHTSPEEAETDAIDDDDADSTVLCDCTFTLACGAATLLKNARLKILHGCVYGLAGANDSGKSALLRAIHDRRVAGFPPMGQIVTSLVEHGIGEKSPECDWTPREYLLNDPAVQAFDLPASHVDSALETLGFADGGRFKQPIRELSGGWRMKLSLARAVLQAADVLLLDEPTGHLDVTNAQWLVNYINDLKNDGSRHVAVAVVVVSHDASFLDKVCTHIIHVREQKLETYRGNYSQFLERVPDAQLGSSSNPISDEQAANEALQTDESTAPLAEFVLPEPGALEGVKSRGKRFLYLDHVTYSYPSSSSSSPAIRNVSAECSLKSRVAIVGPNGAGKSTLAGLLVGELAPDTGTAWRHPNLRVAFVAQHTFHHLERHSDLTATQYILWRFQGNEDREALELRADEEECAEPKTYRFGENGTLVPCLSDDARMVEPEIITDRRQRGRLGYEYEVRWHGRSHVTWVPRAQLASMGFLGMVKREDERHAAQRVLAGRPLTTPGVEAHLAAFGLEAEEASHRRILALSNGQRARVVLAASTWLAPHLLVLDEPSNYLDRPALAALAAGLRAFGGGVVVISHNAALLAEVCSERWHILEGQIQRESNGTEMSPEEDAAREEAKAASEAKAAAAAAAKEAKERKRYKRLKELRRKQGEEVSDDEDEWWEDLLKKTNPKTLSSK